MAKPLEDLGYLVEATRPFKPKVYRPDRLPDPVQCAGCIITICDPANADRLYSAQSDGSSWRKMAFADESPAAVGQPLPAQIDLTPLVREAVAAMMPTLQPSVKVIAPPQDMRGDLAPLATAMLEMSEHINRLMHECAELRARVDEIDGTPIPIARSA